MTDAARRIESASFALFAESQSDAWDRAVGATVEHLGFGVGQVVKVAHREKHPPLIDVQFAHRISTFNADGFKGAHIAFVCASDSLAAGYRKWETEEPARRAAQALVVESRLRAAEVRRKAAEERRAAQALEEEVRRSAAKQAENPWQSWIMDFHRQILALSSFATEITRLLRALTDKDKNLCLAWANRSFGESKSIPEQWKEFVSSDVNGALRMWSARSAEKVAISFFADLGKRTVDVSVRQLDNASTEWLTHDIEVEGEPFDVKNARTSFSSPNSYVEHTIPSFKQARGNALDVRILGVLSDYVPWSRIEQEDFGSATILGVVCKEDLVTLGSWMNKNFGDVLDFSLLGDVRPEAYPGWLFEYPADWYATRPEAEKQISMLLRECPDPNRAKDAIPHYAFEFFDKSYSGLIKVRTSLEDELNNKLLTLRREIGLSRRTLFAWILGTMLRTLTDSGSTAVQETAAALRRLYLSLT